MLSLLLMCAAGCQFLPGPSHPHPTPDVPERITRFSANAAPTHVHSLATLRATAEFWRATDAQGRRRYEGALEPTRDDLYDEIVRRIDLGAHEATLASHEYGRIGWDSFTVVSYAIDGVTIGSDHTALGPITRPERTREVMGWEDMAWWEIAQLPLDALVFGAIGTKEAAFELVKAPLSAIETLMVPPLTPPRLLAPKPAPLRAFRAAVEDLRHAAKSLTWRFRARSPHTPLDLARQLLESAPIVGPWFWMAGCTTAPPDGAKHLFLGQGIHLGDDSMQVAAAWLHRTRELRPDVAVALLPNVEGTAVDVVFSLLGLSHGSAIEAAEQVAFDHGVDSGERIELTGFSGSLQRFLVASRLLADTGISVSTLTGVAGPFRGRSRAAKAVVYWDAEWWNDVVVGLGRSVNAFLFVWPADMKPISVPNAGAHHIPYFPNGTTRMPESGYRRELERPDGG